MAECSYCGHDMLESDGCVDDPIVIDGQNHPPVRYGDEWQFPMPKGPVRRCHDCGAMPGQVHHHGCDVEECPACGGQSISCGCLWEGEEDEDAHLWLDPAQQT